MTHPSLDQIVRDLRSRGFTVDGDERSIVARDGPTTLAGVDAPLEAVRLSRNDPLAVISAVATTAHEGRVPVLVVDEHDRDGVRELLSSPFAIAGRTDGLRQFYTVEDRIQLTDDTFACVDTDGAFSWAEVADSASPESPQLHLRVGGQTVAVLDSVEGLACPGPSPAAFRHRYARGEDGRFRVYEGESAVGSYSGVTDMRTHGVRPVPLPLVPEHHVRTNGHLARAVLLAVPDADGVRYEPART
ncbi:hypothetical protein GRX03_10085 [Halovenus sp. WSH3]|uniref:Uncharacterized protein n=1 Tax=Halovenus carboxidivorans TaxID=2692199 RepID=A0A6B0T170_9EURY|nr:hypothetical protein [Halovenus carboxidivorans]MXR51948.1 hypothetical protein [Halovenus carboxidivorans]